MNRRRWFYAVAFLLVASVLLALWGVEDSTVALPEAPDRTEIASITISVEDLSFDALVAGPAEGEPVLMLHGFPSSNWMWEHQIHALADAGFRVIAPNQRGFSAGARPEGVEHYVIGEMVDDALGMMDTLEYDAFHLVTHDFGAHVGWPLIKKAPERILTANIIGVYHPDATTAADCSILLESAQYMPVGLLSRVLPVFDSAMLRRMLTGVPEHLIDDHVALLGTQEAMASVLNWYSGGFVNYELGPVEGTVMFIFPTEDNAACPEAAEMVENFVTGDYRYEVIEGGDHWLPETMPESVSDLLVDHIVSKAE